MICAGFALLTTPLFSCALADEAPAETPKPLPQVVFVTASPAPTEAPTKVPTKVPTKAPTKAPTPTPKYALPVDQSAGKKPQKSGYKKNSYKDPSITVTISTGRRFDCDYWVARIKIKNASQLRTVSAYGFDDKSGKGKTAITMAKRANAVLAINGDYFNYDKNFRGYCMRQGKLYFDNLQGRRDILLIDEDGDFHAIQSAPENAVAKGKINGKKVINAFYFGPLMVEKGKVLRVMSHVREAYVNEKRQRMAIGQVGPLEYICACCASPQHGNFGMTVPEIAQLMADSGAKIAYNLDGGNSTAMYFNGDLLNTNDKRELADIIYFASGYDGD